MARIKFGNTWWGNAWIEAMEKIDYDTNRLPRGKRYARAGLVKEIKINDSGEILARIQGTRPSPYRAGINLKKFSPGQVQNILSLIASNPLLTAELTLGKLPEDLLPLLEKEKIYLLPVSWKDIQANCSCPDWANPCKHLAAVYYLLANEIDKDPFIIFRLRGISTEKLMQAAGFTPEMKPGAQTLPFIPCAKVKPEKIAKENRITNDNDRIVSISINNVECNTENYTGLVTESPKINLAFPQGDLSSVFSLLSSAPLFYPEGDFKKILLKAYQNTAAALEDQNLLKKDLPLKETSFHLLYPPEKVFNPLSEIYFFAFPDYNLTKFCPGKVSRQNIPLPNNDRLEIKAKKGIQLRKEDLLNLFMRLPLDTSLKNYSPSARFLNVAVATAQALVRTYSFLPEIISNENSDFYVRYVPFIRSEESQIAIDTLTMLITPGFIFRKNDKSTLNGQEAVREILSMVLSYLVHTFSAIDKSDKICSAFFQGKTYKANSFIEKQTAKSIQDWLTRLYLRERDISPLIRIEIPAKDKDKNKDKDKDKFTLQIDVINKNDPFLPPVPLAKIFETQQEIFSCPIELVRSEISQQITIAAEYMPSLKKILHSKGKKSLSIGSQAMADFLGRVKGIFNLLGIQVSIPKELQKLTVPRVTLQAKSQGEKISYLSLQEMLSFSWKVAIGNLTLDEEDFYRLSSSAEGIIRLKDQYVLLKAEEVKNILKQLQQPLPRLSRAEILQASLSGKTRGDVLFKTDPALQEMLNQSFQICQPGLPTGLQARLRPYQERGFQWLYSNTINGFGSCLADDMGLGKTIQVITLILKLKEDNLLKSPALVVCPTTLLGNWEKECARFAPSLEVSIYHGTERQLRISQTDVLITTFGILRRDLKKFKNKNWGLVIIDEAQNIKNPGSEQTRAVKSLKANTCIAMSGTPVENRLTELWSIFDFINPGYFGPLADFIRRFALPIEKYRDQEKIELLKKSTAPFITRRLKTDKSIINDLPDKIVADEYCYLSAEQAALYQQVVDTNLHNIESTEGIERRGLIFKLLNALKQICNHPVHYTRKGKIASGLSGKSQKALSLLEKAMLSGEKTLLFTQYKEMGDLLAEMIYAELGQEVLFFHGGLSRSKRDKMIEEFQSSNRYPILIISLKAGGTGLNLTAASQVIHYDLWWNPAVEQQATDRAFRIGQTQKVLVNRLITLGTFEEKINEMLQSKRELADLTVSTEEQWITEFSDKELREIFSLTR